TCLTFSRDGRSVAAYLLEGTARLWKTQERRVSVKLGEPDEDESWLDVAFDFAFHHRSDGYGEWMLCQLSRRYREARDSDDEAFFEKELSRAIAGANSLLLFSPDGRRLACRSGSEVIIWDAHSGQELAVV